MGTGLNPLCDALNSVAINFQPCTNINTTSTDSPETGFDVTKTCLF